MGITIIPNYTAAGIGDGTQAAVQMQGHTNQLVERSISENQANKRAALQYRQNLLEMQQSNARGYDKQGMPIFADPNLQDTLDREFRATDKALMNVDDENNINFNATASTNHYSPKVAANRVLKDYLPAISLKQLSQYGVTNIDEAYLMATTGKNSLGEPVPEDVRRKAVIASQSKITGPIDYIKDSDAVRSAKQIRDHYSSHPEESVLLGGEEAIGKYFIGTDQNRITEKLPSIYSGPDMWNDESMPVLGPLTPPIPAASYTPPKGMKRPHYKYLIDKPFWVDGKLPLPKITPSTPWVPNFPATDPYEEPRYKYPSY